ncbi:MAG: glycerate kinase [Terriglobales bacterium]
MSEATDFRSDLRQIFLRALAECSIEKAFQRHIEYDRGVLRIMEELYGLPGYDRVLVVSIGKAAHSMVRALSTRVGRGLQGFVVGSAVSSEMVPGFSYFEGGHPVPNADSMRGASAVLRSLKSLTEQSLAIFMISGGGSSILEKPISNEISLEDLIETYRALVLSGAPIAEINAIRKHLSAVKGGRLALAADGARQVSILISDVPENALDSLASGPTVPDSTTVSDCYSIACKYGLVERFPPPVRQLFKQRALDETPKPGDPAFANSSWWVLLANSSALKAAAQHASMERFAVEVDNTCDDWDYAKAADYLLNKLRQLRQGVSRVCLLCGGEVTVKVTNGGTGGRNQQFALYCASKIAGENIAVLSAGTDGIDGNSPAAGAVVDGSTMARASALGMDATTALSRFDAYPLFKALDDAIVTGLTGTNVRDLRILVAY